MLGFGSQKRIAELEEQIAALVNERYALSVELDRLRPYAAIVDIEAEVRKRKADYARQHGEAVAKFKAQVAAAKQKILDEYGKAKAAREAAEREAAEIIRAAKDDALAEYEKLGEEREGVKRERIDILKAARAEADAIIMDARSVTQDKARLAAAKKEIREKQRAEKAAEKERLKAEKAAERERLKAEKAAAKEAEKERIRAERERYLASLPKVVKFDYCDAEGDTTTRTVEIMYLYEGDEGTYMKGYCRLRHDERTFRLDRIQGDIINKRTGEVLTARELARRYDKAYY